MKVDEKIKHLSEEKITNLMRLYYTEEKKTSELIKIFDINISPSKLYTLFPPEELEDKICPHCNSKMYKTRPSKTACRSTKVICLNCQHEDSNRCKCDNCISEMQLILKKQEEERKKELERKENLIKIEHQINLSDVIEINELNFRERIYLSSVLRFALSEDLNIINSINESEGLLAPTIHFTNEIMKHLFEKNIIKVHPSSDISAFKDEPGFPNIIYICKAKYYINFRLDDENTLDELMNPKYDINTDIEEAYEIWKEIALNECLEYLMYQIKKVNLTFNPGDKTILVFNNLLKDYSVSEIYYFIYMAVTYATRYYSEGGISKKQAANSIITKCQKLGEKYLAEQYEIKGYKRAYNLQQSTLSHILFNKVLKIGDAGFTEVPSKELIMSISE